MPHRYRPLLLALCLTALHTGETPSAHAPQYDQPGLWPEDVQKSDYFKEVWPKAPLYVWAAKGAAKIDPKDPANWTVDGQPATKAPDQDCDVLFPSGAVTKLGDERVGINVRHVTICDGVRLAWGFGIKPYGNVWIQEGGSIHNLNSPSGPKNVFLRNDNTAKVKAGKRNEGAFICNKITINKPVGSSIEILGAILTGDEMVVVSGTVIAGPGSEVMPGNRSVQCIFPDGRLVLLSGSSFHKRLQQSHSTDLVVSGQLWAGTPERPLTRDCTLGLSWKAKGDQSQVPPRGNPGSPNDRGLVINPQGSLLVHSADPAKARLLITCHRLHEPGVTKPDFVDVVLQGTLDLKAVHFDRMLKGGIQLANEEVRKKGVFTFGDNQGAPDELFAVLPKPFNAKLLVGMALDTAPQGKAAHEQP